MRFVKMLAVVTLLGTGLASAQALRDKVLVDLPYRVMLNDQTTLEPGEYSITQLGDSGGGRYVLQIRKDDFEHKALVQSIPATQNNTQDETRVILHKLSDGSHRFDKIWVQGKDYGYEFPLPEAIRDRERERLTSSAITARYEADATQEGQPAQAVQDERSTAAITDQSGTTASTPVQPDVTTNPDTDETRATERAANQPAEPVTTEPEAAVTADPIDEQSSTQIAQATGAARDRDFADYDELPQTASHWLGMLTAGLTLMGGGIAIRRRK